MRISASQVNPLSCDWSAYFKEVSGHLYDAAFTIHVPTLQVRGMDGARLRLRSLPYTISTVEDLESMLGPLQFQRISHLLKYCARSYGALPVHNKPPYEVITLLDMPGADSGGCYNVKFVPFGATPNGENEAFLVLLAETLPSSAERDWAIVAHDQGRVLDNLLFHGSVWQFESNLEISYRQRELLRLSAVGYSISMMIEKIGVCESSIKKTRRRLMDFLHASTTASAIRTASVLGLIRSRKELFERADYTKVYS